ncbi:hypothetical protein GCWU000324_01099 [Kingella oralis ATCC 51147]|uniref:Uncharacterized protein n=1 Tax=Kingella oralis ATCC 51147 TaxID=629741 RepID=C4GG32_9NEIS|nr:hypothetical protein GCWU000324_01099 [Kingella oralis ATCC 51147]
MSSFFRLPTLAYCLRGKNCTKYVFSGNNVLRSACPWMISSVSVFRLPCCHACF